MDAPRETQPAPAELVAILEASCAGDNVLSATVLQTIGWHWEAFGCPGNGLWRTPGGGTHLGPLPQVTETAEDARALLPEHVFIATSPSPSGRWTVALFSHSLLAEADYRDPILSASGHTLALALCSATVQLIRDHETYRK
jgi:hypothetical protein